MERIKSRGTISKGVLSILLLLFSVQLLSQRFIAGHTVAKEEVLRKIPPEYIHKARRELVIAYQHTSHGTHVSRGMYGLQDYKTGDTLLFGISNDPAADSLELRDLDLASYAPPGVDAADLSREETAFIQTTRNYLDAPENDSVNVVMWSWCDIAGHDVAGNYLPGMDSLINEYGPGGSRIGTGDGMRLKPVTFIRMTGHANVNANVGDTLRPRAQADTIINYSLAHQQYCLDYYSIDTHDMDDNYWEDAGEDGNSAAYGGNFYRDWQDAHLLGEHWYENKVLPGGFVDYGEHNTQHITANRKAFAMWWILARISGWDGDTTAVIPVSRIEVSSRDSILELQTGDTLRFFAVIIPETASNKEVLWEVVQDSGTASIDSQGLLTAGEPGTVTVVASAADGSDVSDSLTIMITSPEIPVDSILIFSAGDVNTLVSGSALQFTAEVYPVDASNRTVSWSVANLNGSATITTGGILIAGDPGRVQVVATAQDGTGVADTFDLSIVDQVILVEQISISSEGGSTSLESGTTLQLFAEVLPEDATNPAVAWSLINGTGTASISAGGFLTAWNPGTVAILANSMDGSAVADTFYLDIIPPTVPVDSISIASSGQVDTLESGCTLQFSSTVYPQDASNKSVIWSVSPVSGTADISQEGLLTAGNPGTVHVMATAMDGSGSFDTFTLYITVPLVPVGSILVTAASGISELESGSNLQFSAEVYPENASNKNIEWSVRAISGSAVINATGLLTAGNPGEVEVLASARDGSGIVSSYLLSILPAMIKIQSIAITSAGNVNVVEKGDMLQLYATVSPTNASNPSVFWHVSGTGNDPVGTITSTGLFIALGEGKVDAIAIAQDGSGVYAELGITVLGSSSSEAFGEESFNIYPNPGSGLFYLNLENMDGGQLRIINMLGAVVHERILEPGLRQVELDLGGQQVGMYHVHLSSGREFTVKKILIAR